MVIAVALLLGGCYVQARVPVGEPAAPPPPPPEPISAPPAVISQRQAVDIAFAVARERGLEVTHVQHARFDRAGRWHVELRGRGDRAKLLLDGRDGRLLRGKFREHGRDDQGEDED